MKAEDARLIVDAFAKESPEAYKLALAASLAARVEPELVRAYRLNLFPGVEPGAEADLWFSPLVQSQTPVALEFERETLEVLRSDLADDQELLQRAWQVLEPFHASAPFALRLQEELTWLGLSRRSNPDLIEQRLHAVLNEVRAGKRAGLARWASRALPSLPEKTRQTEAARRLSVVVGMQTGIGPVLSAMPSQGMTEDWLSEVTAKKILPVNVGVQLLKNDRPQLQNSAPQPAIESQTLNAAPADAEEASDADVLPMLLEFSYPPSPSVDQIEVPDTYRLLIEVSWLAGERRLLRQLSLLPDETQRVEVGYGEVNIRTALGDIVTIRPRFDYDFMLLYETSTEEWAKHLIERFERQDWQGKSLRLFLAPADAAVSGVSRAALEADFAVSRKIGWATSDTLSLTRMEHLRPEPMGQRDWLIPIKVEEIEPIISNHTAIDFNGPGGFEDGFRALWHAITGEELPQPLPSTEPFVGPDEDGIRVFISFSASDKRYRDLLLRHLGVLVDQGLLANPVFDDEFIRPGQDWEAAIARGLETAQIILLLISPAYLASSFAEAERRRAMERRQSGGARVIPVILTPSDWQGSPLYDLPALPDNAVPVSEWKVTDEAFANIIEGVRRVAEDLYITRAGARRAAIPRPPIVGFMTRRDSEGRDVVEWLTEVLAPGRSGMIVLWGMGGIGKTTIAAESARQLRSAYDGRIVWSSAEGRPGFKLNSLLDDIAIQLGDSDVLKFDLEMKGQAVGSLLERNPALVVLGNYETIASDEKNKIRSWLERSPCAALITSREFIENARNISIPILSEAEGEELLERLSEQSVNPRILDRTTRQRIYQTAGGNPLVMEWVVRQIEFQDADAVLNEVTQGKGDAVSVVFDQAFDLPQFSEDGRAVVLALSLFVPSAGRRALAEVAGFRGDSSRLKEAVKLGSELSIIDTTENGRVTVTGLIRTLARARFSKDDRAVEFNRRFVDYFRRYAESHAAPPIKGFGSVDEGFESVGGAGFESVDEGFESVGAGVDGLDVEKDNLLVAVDLAFKMGDSVSVLAIADILANPARSPLMERGYSEEALQLAQRGLTAARSLKDERRISRFSFTLASMFTWRGNLDEARRLYHESLEIDKKLDDQNGIALALNELGLLAQKQGDTDESRRLLSESLEIYRRLNDQSGIAVTLSHLGVLAQDRGEFDEARRLYEQSLEISNELGDRLGTANTLNQIGIVLHQQGDLDQAQRYYNASLETYMELNNQNGIANTQLHLGMLAKERHQLEEARRRYEESLTLYRQVDNQQGIATVLHQHGLLAEATGDRAEARRLLQRSLKMFESLHSPNAEQVRRLLRDLERADLV